MDSNLASLDYNKRKYFRIEFYNPLQAKMKIIQVKQKDLESSTSIVNIKDISAGGLCFFTDLNFPVKQDVLLEFEVVLIQHNFQLPGYIVRKTSIEDNKYEYGVHFVFFHESLQCELIKVLNKIAIIRRRNTKYYK